MVSTKENIYVPNSGELELSKRISTSLNATQKNLDKHNSEAT